MDLQQELQISLTVLITGLVVVFLMLVFLTMIIKGYGNAVHTLQSRYNHQKGDTLPLPEPKPVSAVEPAPREPQLSAVGESMPDEVLAVIAAAAASMIPGGTVTSIRRAAASDFDRSSWRMAGMLENTRPF